MGASLSDVRFTLAVEVLRPGAVLSEGSGVDQTTSANAPSRIALNVSLGRNALVARSGSGW